MIHTQTTEGIKVSVETHYLAHESRPKQKHFVFAYRISITNESPQTVQLLSREWFIRDAVGKKNSVKGSGVVGRQPVIAPGTTYTYMSGTYFETPIGSMHGNYVMMRLDNEEAFKVVIPTFVMASPAMLN